MTEPLEGRGAEGEQRLLQERGRNRAAPGPPKGSVAQSALVLCVGVRCLTGSQYL